MKRLWVGLMLLGGLAPGCCGRCWDPAPAPRPYCYQPQPCTPTYAQSVPCQQVNPCAPVAVQPAAVAPAAIAPANNRPMLPAR